MRSVWGWLGPVGGRLGLVGSGHSHEDRRAGDHAPWEASDWSPPAGRCRLWPSHWIAPAATFPWVPEAGTGVPKVDPGPFWGVRPKAGGNPRREYLHLLRLCGFGPGALPAPPPVRTRSSPIRPTPTTIRAWQDLGTGSGVHHGTRPRERWGHPCPACMRSPEGLNPPRDDWDLPHGARILCSKLRFRGSTAPHAPTLAPLEKRNVALRLSRARSSDVPPVHCWCCGLLWASRHTGGPFQGRGPH